MKRTLSLIVVILFLFTSCYDDGHYERPPINQYKNRILVDASHDGGVYGGFHNRPLPDLILLHIIREKDWLIY